MGRREEREEKGKEEERDATQKNELVSHFLPSRSHNRTRKNDKTETTHLSDPSLTSLSHHSNDLHESNLYQKS